MMNRLERLLSFRLSEDLKPARVKVNYNLINELKMADEKTVKVPVMLDIDLGLTWYGVQVIVDDNLADNEIIIVW